MYVYNVIDVVKKRSIEYGCVQLLASYLDLHFNFAKKILKLQHLSNVELGMFFTCSNLDLI